MGRGGGLDKKQGTREQENKGPREQGNKDPIDEILEVLSGLAYWRIGNFRIGGHSTETPDMQHLTGCCPTRPTG